MCGLFYGSTNKYVGKNLKHTHTEWARYYWIQKKAHTNTLNERATHRRHKSTHTHACMCACPKTTLTPSILLWLNIWPWKLLPNTPLCIRSGRMIIVWMGAIVIVAKTIEVIAILILDCVDIIQCIHKHAQINFISCFFVSKTESEFVVWCRRRHQFQAECKYTKKKQIVVKKQKM